MPLRPSAAQDAVPPTPRQVLRTTRLAQHDLIQPPAHERLVQVEHRTEAAPVQPQWQRHRPVSRAAQIRQVGDHDHSPSGPRLVPRPNRNSGPDVHVSRLASQPRAHEMRAADARQRSGTADGSSEDLIHDLCASGERRDDLVSVDQFGCRGLVVPGQQRDRLDGHAMRGQQ